MKSKPLQGRSKGVKPSPFLKSLLGQSPTSSTAGMAQAEQAVQKAIPLLNTNQLKEAEALLRQADVLACVHPLGIHILAIICAQTKRFEESNALWELMLKKNLLTTLVYVNYGRSLQLQENYERALPMLQAAAKQAPDDFTTQLNLAVCLQHVQQIDLALKHIQRAIELSPNNAQAHFNLGRIHQDRYAFEVAHAAYMQALRIDPAHQDAAANVIFTYHYRSDLDLSLIRKLASDMGQSLCRQLQTLTLSPPSTHLRLRVGLLSADFHAHPVGWFLLNVLPHVDASQIELIGFYNGRDNDHVTQALMSACPGGWHMVDHLSDQVAAELVQSCGVDVLFDLSGLTSGNRKGILAYRPAPVQTTWLGYFGTTGLPTVDYLLADPHCVPANEEHFYTEKIWRLPHSRFCFAEPEQASDVAPLPALSKPDHAITFASFQELAKINDQVLRVWAQIMSVIANARLRLQSSKLARDEERQQLVERLQACGFDLARIDLHAGVDRAAYLQAHAEVDLILDTFPYTGGTTTCEALWMGVPTLTLARPGMLSRQGQAHLINVGLADWVADSEASYIQKAVTWSTSQGVHKLAQLRLQLRERCKNSPLFDGPCFAADWVQAIQGMHSQAIAGEGSGLEVKV